MKYLNIVILKYIIQKSRDTTRKEMKEIEDQENKKAKRLLPVT